MEVKNTRRRGAVVELRFALACIERHAMVAAPWGDYAPYDWIVDNGTRLYRVQVKSAHKRTARSRGGWQFPSTSFRQVYGTTKSYMKPYAPNSFDVLVGYLGGHWAFYPEPEKCPNMVYISDTRPCAHLDDWSVLGLPNDVLTVEHGS